MASGPKKKPSVQNGKTVQVRLPEDQLAQVEAWEQRQPDAPSRSETIRRLLAIALNDRRQIPR